MALSEHLLKGITTTLGFIYKTVLKISRRILIIEPGVKIVTMFEKYKDKLNPRAEGSIGFPAKLLLNGSVTENKFPDW